jgi:hypothetical protein
MDPSTLNTTANGIANAATALNVTTPQLITWSNQVTTIPSLIILFAVTHLLFLMVGLSFDLNKKKKFLTIWFITFVLSGILLLVLIYLPYSVQKLLGYLQ